MHTTPTRLAAFGGAAVIAIVTTACMPSDPPTSTTTSTTPPFVPTTQRISFGPGGTQLHHPAIELAISDDGRWLAFTTVESFQAEDDANGEDEEDVYVRNPDDLSVRMMSPPAFPSAATTFSVGPSLDASGQRVAFWSLAENLVFNDQNNLYDAFTTSVLAAAPEAVALATTSFPYFTGNGVTLRPVVSGNGRFVAFGSSSSNLMSGDSNGAVDAFVRDLNDVASERVSLSTSGAEANGASIATGISSDGRYVAFTSAATNLDPADTESFDGVYLRDRQTGTTTLVSRDSAGISLTRPSGEGQVSDDGRYVVFVNRVSSFEQVIYRKDLLTGELLTVSVRPDGTRFPVGYHPSMSRDGRFVAFFGMEEPVPVGQPRAYVRDLQVMGSTLVSATSSGSTVDVVLNESSLRITGDGRAVAFVTPWPLAADDTNGVADVYLHRFRP